MIAFRPAPASLPAGQRVYAVGDIHGCAARLSLLHAQIAADLAARPVAAPTLLHLGDYVDKGEDSAGVLAYLAGPLPLPLPGHPVARVDLAGNHEVAMLAALDGAPGDVADWLWCGGRATLDSYGLSPEATPAEWRAAIPPAHLAWMRGLTAWYRAGGYLFVHAGIRPGLPLEAQAPEDLVRIRQPFLSSEASHGMVVVHGHTARSEPEIRHNRINLDTAAWSGGPLTCAVLEADRIGFLQA
ncbi:MAG TPA: metallophosphoesterase [Roseomonas sp.]|nr:metallophosphoesterase [Roseomonas sp.]